MGYNINCHINNFTIWQLSNFSMDKTRENMSFASKFNLQANNCKMCTTICICTRKEK